MPRELFSPSVVGVSTAARRGRLLPLSILFHAVLIGAILALQLFADTTVPEPQKKVTYEVTPLAPPPASPQIARRAPTSHASVHPDAAPIVIPEKLPTEELTSQSSGLVDLVGPGSMRVCRAVSQMEWSVAVRQSRTRHPRRNRCTWAV